MHGNLHRIEVAGIRAIARPQRGRWPVASISIAVFLLAFVAISAATKPPQAAVKEAPPGPPPPAWIDIAQPIQLFNLDAPDIANSTLTYEARRHRTGDGRQDVLTFGKLSGEAPFVRLVLYRVGREKPGEAPFFVDLARVAASAGLSVARSLTPEDLATRFGDLEAADVDLAAGSGAPTPCLGFRGVLLDGGFRMSGFACGAPEKPLSRPALACLIDRLDLNSAGDDQALAGFFAATELRRDPFCAGTGLAPMAIQASWIDQDDAPPPLRLRKAR
jgi:hypothetical protein